MQAGELDELSCFNHRIVSLSTFGLLCFRAVWLIIDFPSSFVRWIFPLDITCRTVVGLVCKDGVVLVSVHVQNGLMYCCLLVGIPVEQETEGSMADPSTPVYSS